MNSSDYMDNISYLFFPFECRGEWGEQFPKENSLWGESPFITQLSSHESWKRKEKKDTLIEIGYMQKYVSDKIDTDNPACQCFHFELRSSHREKYGLGNEDAWFHIDSYGEQEAKKSYHFQISKVEMFCFSTNVGILALKLHFEDQSPLGISSAQYYLKKVSQAQIFRDPDNQMSQSVLRFVKNITSDLNIHYFYFSNERKERSNMLTLLTVKKCDAANCQRSKPQFIIGGFTTLTAPSI